MGLKPREVKELYLRDFNLMLTGYQKRRDHDTNQTRHIMSFIKAFGGMGGSEFTSPQKLWPLSMDAENEKRMITSITGARELLKEFMDTVSVNVN